MSDKNNPLEDTFEPVVVEDFDSEYEATKTPPLPEATYKLEIVETIITKTDENSKLGKDIPKVQFSCKVVDDDTEENNGRKIRTQNYVLLPGNFVFRFFMDFASSMTPTRKFKKGKITKEYLESFVGCQFKAEVVQDVEMEDDRKTPKLDEGGNKILTGWNSISVVSSLRA